MRSTRVAVGLLALTALIVPSVRAASLRATQAQQLAQIESVTESIRQLKHTRPVKAAFPSKATFDALLTSEMTADNPDAEIQLNQRESVVVGFLKPTDDLKKITFSGLTAQVTGFYDYHQHILYVPNGGNTAFGPERYVIAHEYTHALQDEHYNLKKLLPDQYPLQYRNSDAVGARHALTEGDAVNLQNLYIHRTYTPSDLAALIRYESQPVHTPPIPPAIEREFYFPYTTGVDFVARLYASGGMAAIDAAYHRLPRSTYEIMHPTAYLAGWKPVSVSLHHVTGFDAWKQTDDDVFGAFGYNLLLWQDLGAKRANAVTDAYRGDRYLFLENGSQEALLMKSVWTSHHTALLAQSALLAAFHIRFPHLKTSKAANGTLGAYLGGAVYLRVAGGKLTVDYAPNAALAQQLGTAATS